MDFNSMTVILLPKSSAERCENEGVSALSEAELLAIVLQTGTKTESAVGLAERLLKRTLVLR